MAQKQTGKSGDNETGIWSLDPAMEHRCSRKSKNWNKNKSKKKLKPHSHRSTLCAFVFDKRQGTRGKSGDSEVCKVKFLNENWKPHRHRSSLSGLGIFWTQRHKGKSSDGEPESGIRCWKLGSHHETAWNNQKFGNFVRFVRWSLLEPLSWRR